MKSAKKWPEMVVKRPFGQLQILMIKSLLQWHYQQIATPTFSKSPIFYDLQAHTA